MEAGGTRLITVRAAAERLGVGYSTFKRWVLSGRVRTTLTAGGHHRVAESGDRPTEGSPAAIIGSPPFHRRA